MAGSVLQGEGFSVSFSHREVTVWGGLALFRQMLDSMGLREAAAGWGLSEPKSHRGDAPLQLIEQFSVSIWCGACRFAHAETVRMDGTLVRQLPQAGNEHGCSQPVLVEARDRKKCCGDTAAPTHASSRTRQARENQVVLRGVMAEESTEIQSQGWEQKTRLAAGFAGWGRLSA